MAERKVNLLDDLALPKILDASWAGKEAGGSCGSDDCKSTVGSHDEGKDQVISENSVPLSPQWLYAKPTENRPNFLLASGKDARVQDGVQDKKEWRRPVPDIESSRRWREEERETGLLGRRDRKKDSDREMDNRKSDRRMDNVISREAVDAKAMSTNERRHDASGRNPVHRDNKWSLRWGPDDKEESRSEKRIDSEKEDTQNEKQPFTSSRISDSDSRDKWRPRVRQESTIGATVYRAAPGFGLERGRVDGSNKGFTSGRGRSNLTSVQPSVGSIGSVPSGNNVCEVRMLSLSPVKYRHPRGKLLDIYRSNLSAFDVAPVGAEAPGIVTPNFLKPLAFITPGEEEEAVLDDIWLGNITNSEALHVSESNGKDGVDGKYEREDGILECSVNKFSSRSEMVLVESNSILLYDHMLEDKPGQIVKVSGEELLSEGLKPIDAHPNPLVDSSSLFDASLDCSVQPSIGACLNEKHEIELLERQTPPEEWSLLYMDPQGEVQGPFLGVDIISWFEQGFFGTDLPVCFSDAPEGTPLHFKELGELMPNLKSKFLTSSGIIESGALKSSNNAVGGLNLTFSGPSMDNNKAWLSTMAESNADQLEISTLPKQDVHHKRAVLETNMGLQDDFLHSMLPETISHTQDDYFSSRNSSGDPRMVSGEVIDTDMTNPTVPADNANPLKLLYSELEAISQIHPLSSNIPGATNSEKFTYSSMCRDPSSLRLKSSSGGNFTEAAPILEALASNRRATDSNFLSEDMDNYSLSHMDQNTSHFNLEEHIMSQQLRKQRMHHHDLMGAHQAMHLDEPIVEQISGIRRQQQSLGQHAIEEHALKLHLQQQQVLKLQQQRQQQRQLQQLQQQLHQHHQLQLMQQQQQQQQQSMAHQLILQQLMQQSARDPSFASSADAIHGRSILDQVLLRQQLLHEQQQQQALHPSRHHDLALEQLLHAKPTQSFQDEHKLRQKLFLEQQLLGLKYEQCQAAPLSGPRQSQCIDDDGRSTGFWPVEDAQFVGGASGSLQSQSSSFNQLDFLRRQQRQTWVEHQNMLERERSMHNRIQRGLYDSGLQSFDVPAGNHGLPPEHINSLNRIRSATHEQKNQVPLTQFDQFSSGLNSQQHQVSSRFPAVHSEALEMQWSESNRLPENFVETQLNRYSQKTEGQGHATKIKYGSDGQNTWLRASENDNARALMELLRRKDGAYSPEPFERNVHHTYNPYEIRERNWHSAHSSSDPSRILLGHQEPNHHSIIAQDHSAILSLNGMSNGRVVGERLSERSDHGNLTADEQFLARVSRVGEPIHDNSYVSTGLLLESADFFGTERNVTNASSLADTEGVVGLRSSLVDNMVFPVDMPVRNSSTQSSGSNLGFKPDVGSENAFSNDARVERHSMVPNASIPPRGLLNLQGVASHQGLPEVASAQILKGKMLGISSEVLRQGGNTQVLENLSSNQRDFRISRSPSIGESDAPEASSYVEMVKAPRKSSVLEVEAVAGSLEPVELGQGTKGNKKKGKKGRQIDPSLLGFKVHSNRIMMGEIQRLDN